MNKCNVVAIVVTYNGIKWIEKCIKSLICSSIPVDIVVVDNGSNDGTIEIIEKKYSSVRLIKNATNLYFGRGNNIGLKIALDEGYDYAFLLNQDAWISKDTIALLVKAHAHNKEFGILSPIHLDGSGSELEIKFAEYINVYDCPGLISDKFLDNTLKEIYQIRFVNAAAWLISKECLRAVGGFDPLFHHYGEDEDYLRRVYFKKLKVGIVPSTFIYHDSKFKTWDQIKTNIDRLVIINLLELKRPGVPYRSSFLTFIKFSFDRGGSYLIFRKWNDFKFWFLSFMKTFKYFKQIPSSLKESYKKTSFLR